MKSSAAALLLIAAAACAQPLTPCEPPDVPGPVLCGFVPSPADHAAPGGATIRLRVMVLKATAPEAAPDPLVYLDGGPGSAATASAASLAEDLSALRRRRDIVLIDQRGAGDSVTYNCTLTAADGRPASLTSSQLSPRMIEICAKGPGAVAGAPDGMDARFFTTTQSADDVAAVTATLGYGELNLYGVSYGTRLGLVFLNRHPNRVRTLSLQSVVLPSEPIPVTATRATQEAIDRVVSDCEADSLCAGSFPDFGAQLRSILTGPQRIYANAVTAALYSATASAGLPAAVAEAVSGNYSRLLGLPAGSAPATTGGMSTGLYLSILCAEDTPFIADEDLAQLAKQTFAGDATARALMRTCAPWPQGAVSPASRELPTAAKPVLLISGELDPITPASQAAMAAEALPASRHVVMRATGHSGAADPCAVRMITEFTETADVNRVDAACAEQSRRPRWVMPLPEPLAPFR